MSLLLIIVFSFFFIPTHYLLFRYVLIKMKKQNFFLKLNLSAVLSGIAWLLVVYLFFLMPHSVKGYLASPGGDLTTIVFFAICLSIFCYLIVYLVIVNLFWLDKRKSKR